MTKRLPLAFLAILLIVLLAGLGVAYGLWSETLTIEGTVKTGDVDVEFVNDQKTELVNGGSEPSEKANAANCTVSIIDQPEDNSALEITVTGAYPSWSCVVAFEVKSVGSVPVHIYKPDPLEGYQNPEWVVSEECYDDDTQLHQGDTAACKLVIHFTNNDQVSEKSTYTFGYFIEARQWNEPRPQDEGSGENGG